MLVENNIDLVNISLIRRGPIKTETPSGIPKEIKRNKVFMDLPFLHEILPRSFRENLARLLHRGTHEVRILSYG